ncbi:hypothetical protein [Blastococcus saxobsidens]|uniref:Uncharacterized protein n=1 Tax=Blastococcus saxobsidens TaxID=138336 RepID=A0A4Q7Y8T3_9ACTN|nr:hypothetical protein [Blastococcus saxobsidens]RZU32459.1 hypothetical protein BKA19_2154 [Blastococcus saxobsidens]
MGRRRRSGTYPYDYTEADDRRFLDSGAGGTLRVLHGPGRGMGMTDGVLCRVEVVAADGAVLDQAAAGSRGKEHRLHGSSAGDCVTVSVSACFDGDDGCGGPGCLPVLDELTAARAVVLTGDLADVVRFGVGPAWDEVLLVDTGELDGRASRPAACRWGAGVRLRGARPVDRR